MVHPAVPQYASDRSAGGEDQGTGDAFIRLSLTFSPPLPHRSLAAFACVGALGGVRGCASWRQLRPQRSHVSRQVLPGALDPQPHPAGACAFVVSFSSAFAALVARAVARPSVRKHASISIFVLVCARNAVEFFCTGHCLTSI